jgi:hypothetical protein
MPTLFLVSACVGAEPAITLTVQCDKIYLRPGETQFATITAQNSTRADANLKLKVTLLWDVNSSRVLGEPALKVPASGSAKTTLVLPAGPELFGYEVRAEGTGVAPASGFFGVHHNFWQVTLQGSVPGGHLHISESPKITEAERERAMSARRTSLCNHVEFFAWAPDDFSTLVPQTEYWFAGQTGYPGSRLSLHTMVDYYHSVGATTSIYAKGQLGGPAAFEFFRRKPLWGVHPYHGQWNLLDLKLFVVKTPLFEGRNTWPRAMCDFGRADIADWHIQQLRQASQEYHFDGVRYDDHLAVNWAGEASPKVTARNMEQTIKQLRVALPYYGFGYNWIASWMIAEWQKNGNKPPWPDWPIAAASGAQMMDEEVGQIYGSSRPKTGLPWADYIQRLKTDRAMTESLGGKVFIMFNSGLPPTDSSYRNALVFALRLHHTNYDGNAPLQFGRFATRFSTLIWNDNPIDIPADQVQITAARPLWGAEFAYRYQLAPGRGRAVVHLFNPPAGPKMGAEPRAAFPDPIANVKVKLSLPQGWQATSGTVIDAGTLQTKPVPVSGGAVDVAVPSLAIWSVLVVDCKTAE